MTYQALLTEVTRRPRDEQRALLATLVFEITDEIGLPKPQAYQIAQLAPLPAGDLAFPDDPALAALEAEFE